MTIGIGRMRVNPKYNNVCANRIGMYRSGQCIDGPHPCIFLSECDKYYDEKTGEFNYGKSHIPLAGHSRLVPTEGGAYSMDISPLPFKD